MDFNNYNKYYPSFFRRVRAVSADFVDKVELLKGRGEVTMRLHCHGEVCLRQVKLLCSEVCLRQVKSSLREG